jgi:hypothetical protein
MAHLGLVDPSSLSQFVKGDVNENMQDEEIKVSTVGEVFDKWLTFNGIIGYSQDIRRVLFDIITSTDLALSTLDYAKTQELRNLFGLEVNEILK